MSENDLALQAVTNILGKLATGEIGGLNAAIFPGWRTVYSESGFDLRITPATVGRRRHQKTIWTARLRDPLMSTVASVETDDPNHPIAQLYAQIPELFRLLRERAEQQAKDKGDGFGLQS